MRSMFSAEVFLRSFSKISKYLLKLFYSLSALETFGYLLN